ncbi:nucleoside hydrolase-like domain-containing protein [Falsirhodobacter sp. 1013]|uniref:nucleoside hydrolase-like domain-containing protein n=1 Tax=Falsirhodobacter sp. 1013 TaxID=3417566 RepID=UPI003EBD3CF6
MTNIAPSKASSLDLHRSGQPHSTDSWLVSDWNAGQSTLTKWSANNARIAADGQVELVLSSGNGSGRSVAGGEIQNTNSATTGTWGWTAQAPDMVSGAVFGMFTYTKDWKNQPWVEFDFEFVGADTTKVQLNIHMEDAQGRHVVLDEAARGRAIIDLGFDAAKGLHTYEVTVTEKDATFYIDGKVVGVFSAKDMQGDVWQIGPMNSFVDLWAVDKGQEAWAGQWKGLDEPLVARVSDAEIRPGEFDSNHVSAGDGDVGLPGDDTDTSDDVDPEVAPVAPTPPDVAPDAGEDASSPPRVFISTDLRLNSAELDDAQSLIHALMYQDKMDIVGISATASKWGIQDGLVKDVKTILDVYEKDQAKLQAHSDDFKTAAELRAVSWQGATEVAPSQGFSRPTDGSRAIVEQARDAAAAGEKLSVLVWGGETDIAQALHDAPDIAPHIRLFTINTQDDAAYDYIAANFKGKLDMWVDNQSSYFGMWKSGESGDYINGWHQKHADGHGALGDMFADLSVRIHGQAGVKMGDSPTVLRFLSGDLDDPTKESWGGEFIKVSKGYYTDNPAYTQYGKVGAGSISEDRNAWMGDFAERLDWLRADASARPPTVAPTPAPEVNPTPSGANLLVNGSFESSHVAAGKYATFGSVSGWTALSGGGIELWNGMKGVKATQGDTYAELDFVGARDGFYQDVDTVARQTYTLSFDLQGRPGASLSTQQVEVVWNDKVVATATPGASWGTFRVDVIGTGGDDRLTIREVGHQSSDGLGALLDDFSLVAKGGPSPVSPPVVEPPPVEVPSVETPAPVGKAADYSDSARAVVADLETDAGYRVLNILPFGDSLTEGYVNKGNTESGGYRTFLWNDLVDQGIQVNMVGGLSDGPSGIDADHQGHRGWTINQLNATHDQVLKNTDPDVVMLIAGGNDSFTDSVSQMLSDLQTLVTNISADKPEATILVGSLTPLRVGQYPQSMADKLDAYSEAMGPMIENLAKQGHNVAFVDMSSLQVSDMSSLSVDNGMHPTEAGYEKMADLWLEAFRDHLALDETGIGQERDILTGIKSVVGSAYGDTLKGDGQGNTLSGLGGDDLLDGRGGDDVLTGGAGRDTLTGGAGTDILFGGDERSKDTFVFNTASESRPGTARDTVHDFVFNTASESRPGTARDTVHDFVSGIDAFDFRAFDANASASGHQDVRFSGSTAAAHSVWTVGSGKDLLLRADVTGDRIADFEALVTDIGSLARNDFLF